jgi:hypothetical protein
MRRLGHWLMYGGSTRLRPYERVILERVAAELEPAESPVLLQHLRSFERVQRFQKDRMVVFHFRSGEDVTRLSVEVEAIAVLD